jgi:hypothetical protein
LFFAAGDAERPCDCIIIEGKFYTIVHPYYWRKIFPLCYIIHIRGEGRTLLIMSNWTYLQNYDSVISVPCDCACIIIKGRFYTIHVLGVKYSHYDISFHIRGASRTLLIMSPWKLSWRNIFPLCAHNVLLHTREYALNFFFYVRFCIYARTHNSTKLTVMHPVYIITNVKLLGL